MKKIFTTISILLLLAVFLCAFLAIETTGILRPDKQVEIVIENGSSTQSIARQLKESDLVFNARFFTIYAKLKGLDTGFQYGTYQINAHSSYLEMIETLSTVQTFEEYIDVTIPEGLTGWQVAEIFNDCGLCSYDEFLDALLQTDQYDYWFLTYDDLDLMPLDGYLYPDTYSFYTDATPTEIINKLLTTFEEKALTDENVRLCEDLGLSIRQWVSLAAIIQRESFADDIMDDVSGVFHNRLEEGSGFATLQSDTTTYYLNHFAADVYSNNIPDNIREHYDSYQTFGIPNGVIASSGIEALNAALHPAEHDYYFFVTDVEYNYYFGTTMSQHESNIAKAIAVNKTHGIEGLT